MMKGWFILSLLLFVSSCANDRAEEKKFRNVSEGGKVEAVEVRLDKDILSLSDNGLSALADKYAPSDTNAVNIVELYTREILHIGGAKSSDAQLGMNQFRRSMAYKRLMEDCDSAFTDLGRANAMLNKSFTILNSNIDKFNAPSEYVYYMGGFYSNIATTDRHLCFGMEFYLGQNYQLYKAVDGLYDYMIYNYRPEMIPVDGVRGWLKSEYPREEMIVSDNMSLLDAMIYEGIITFAVSVACEDSKMADIFGYTDDQYEWCEANEKKMWDYLAENKQLFSTERLTISKYIDPAPNTAFFPSDSPGRSGWYVGYKIVSSYMKNNPKASLSALFNDKISSKTLLQMSRYNP